MTTTYGGADAFPTSITLPADGEPAVVASVNVPLEGVADRTVYLRNRLAVLDGGALRNLQPMLRKDSGGTDFDFAYIRLDGTGSSTSFWSPTYSLWIKTGVNQAGKFYIGDNGFFALFNTAATAPPKVAFGCDTAIQDVSPGRVSVFCADSVASSPKYILGPAAGDFTGTWTTKTLDANVYATFVRPNDCVVTPTQRIVVVGGGDISGFGQLLAWRSDDNGNTFTRVVIDNVAAFGEFLTRVIVGAGGRLVAFVNAAAAVHGAVLWYSDDNGSTWSSRAAIGFDNIQDGAYIPALGLWCFSSGTSIYTTTDPVLGSFTAHAIGPTPTALAAQGHFLMYGQVVSTNNSQLRLSVDGLTSSGFVGRDPIATQVFRHIGVSPFGQMCICSANTLTLTEKL